jgi:hypothetical protein
VPHMWLYCLCHSTFARLALEPKLRNGDTRCCVWTPCVNHLPLVAFITIPELAWYGDELPEIDGATCWCTPRRRDAIAAAGLVLPMWNAVCTAVVELWHAASCEVLLAWLHVGRNHPTSATFKAWIHATGGGRLATISHHLPTPVAHATDEVSDVFRESKNIRHAQIALCLFTYAESSLSTV